LTFSAAAAALSGPTPGLGRDFSPGAPILTVTPVASWLRFDVARDSVPFSPLVISTSEFCRAPRVTCCARALPSR
jgi:hypothetical protein